MAKVIDGGWLPPDDPVYSRGLRVKGKRLTHTNEPSNSREEKLRKLTLQATRRAEKELQEQVEES